MEDEKEIQKLPDDTKKMKDLAAVITFDKEIYCADRFEGYEQSIPVNDDDDIAEDNLARKMSSFTAPKQFFKDLLRGGEEEDEISGFRKPSRVIDREDEYRRRWRFNRMLSPDRVDPFLDKTPAKDARTYADVMKEEALKRKEVEVKRLAAKKMKELEEDTRGKGNIEKRKRTNRWDVSKDDDDSVSDVGSDWDSLDSTSGIGTWDVTPIVTRGSRWDEAPTPCQLGNSDATLGATRLARRNRSRWDETPFTVETGVAQIGSAGMATGKPSSIMSAKDYNNLNWCGTFSSNRWKDTTLTDEELDARLPEKGYTILEPPPSYVSIGTPAAAPEENQGQQIDVKKMPGGLPTMKPEDYQNFGVLLKEEHQCKLVSPVVQHSPEVC